METLEADVRSKFQTKRRIEDASRGLEVEVPFDEAFIKFFWVDSRTMELTDVIHYTESVTEQEKAVVDALLQENCEGEENDGQVGGETSDVVDISIWIQHK